MDITKRFEKDLIIVFDTNSKNMYTDSQSNLFKMQSRESVRNNSKKLDSSFNQSKDLFNDSCVNTNSINKDKGVINSNH